MNTRSSNLKRRFLSVTIGALAALASFAGPAIAELPAKKLFGSKSLPAALKAQAHGFYSKGCVQGAQAMPIDGPHWQTMRLSRNRRWGHPDLLKIIESLSYKAHRDGWNGLLVGDISQPRGGPMLTGHSSHQMGLDADIWFTPMPKKRMTYKERETTSAISVLKRDSNYVDRRRWNQSYTQLLYHAASFPKIERILVHPGVKKKLCDTVKGERTWLSKIRPYYGHHYHFHIRMKCPAGSPNCRPQKPTGTDTGCGAALDWWYNVAFAPKKKTAKKKPPRKRRELGLDDLPRACKQVLNAPSTAKSRAQFRTRQTAFAAPKITLPAWSAASALASQPIERSGQKIDQVTGSTQQQLPAIIPVPTARPGK